MNDVLEIEIEDFLSHHGILGMHWGIRKTRVGSNSIKKHRYSYVKNRRNLSDEQLNKYIDRLQRERALKTLTEDNLNPGRRATKEMLSAIGKTTVTAVIGTAAAFGVQKLLKNKFGG